VTFLQAIKSGFANYKSFSGRATRSEFWYFILFCVLIELIVGRLIDNWLAPAIFWSSEYGYLPFGVAFLQLTGGRPITILFLLATFVANLSLSIRRLHDLNRSGWFVLLSLIPLVGAVVLLIWFAQQGTAGKNKFGDDPIADETVGLSKPS
jgi:uncharacterized membrane protein YhaH (DUF805 family)